jgi:LysR family transcriptional regulator for bpeEF and oprC
LTETGQAIYERALVILKLVDEAESIARDNQSIPQGLLRLTCGVEFGMLYVSHWITSFMSKYPSVTIEANYTGELLDLIQEGYDLAIRIGELDDSQLIAKHIGYLEYGLFASQKYLDQCSAPKHPSDLQHHQCIVFNAGLKNQWQFSKNGESITEIIKPQLAINNTFAVKEACCLGLGIAKLPLTIAKLAPESHHLVQIMTNWKIPKAPVNAIFPSLKYLPSKVRYFIDEAKL